MMRDVIVLTAHGRGQWLCHQLEKARYNFFIIDVSSLLGTRTTEDRLGPFGYFKDPLFDMSDEQWLDSRSYHQEQGFTVWTSEGLFESQGLLAQHQWQMTPKTELQEVMTSLLSVIDDPCLPPLISETRLQSAYYVPTADIDFNPQDSLHSALLLQDEEIQMSINGAVKSFTFHDGVEETRLLANFLTSAEVSHLFPFTSGDLLFAEPLEPKAVWLRATIDIQSPLHLEELPQQTLFVRHLDHPWIEDNTWILKRQEQPHVFSLWIKAWYPAARGPQDMQLLTESVCGSLEEYFPHSRVTVIEPFLSEKTAHKPPMYPVFDRDEWEQQKKFLEKGVIYGGPEKWRSYSLHDRFAQEKHVYDLIRGDLQIGAPI